MLTITDLFPLANASVARRTYRIELDLITAFCILSEVYLAILTTGIEHSVDLCFAGDLLVIVNLAYRINISILLNLYCSIEIERRRRIVVTDIGKFNVTQAPFRRAECAVKIKSESLCKIEANQMHYVVAATVRLEGGVLSIKLTTNSVDEERGWLWRRR